LVKKAAVITLGCAKNSVDSEHIKGSLVTSGISVTEDFQEADYVIVNTCGFIEAAKQESIDVILDLAKSKACLPHLQQKLIVTGCLAQRYYNELAKEIPEIDLLVDLSKEFEIPKLILEKEKGAVPDRLTDEKGAVPERLKDWPPLRDFSKLPKRLLSDQPFAYLQIADGCNNRCSYCAIPLIRGKYRSKPIEQIIDEAKWLDERGIKEVNIIAQDTGNYGYDIYGRRCLPDLINSLKGFKNIKWLRLLYLQPYSINDDLIESISKNDILLPYIDVPFQHASPKILHAMNRHGAGSDYLAQIAWLRRAVPNVVLRTSLIVGFPGETDDDFKELSNFVESAQFDYAGIFEYSREEGTQASTLPDMVPRDVIKERYHQLTALQDLISQKRSENRIGKAYDVLIEKRVETAIDKRDSSKIERQVDVKVENQANTGSGLFEARAWWQAPEVDGYIYVQGYEGGLKPGQIVKAQIDEFDGCDFYGRLLGGPGK